MTIQEPPGPPVEHPSLDQPPEPEVGEAEGFLETSVGVLTEPVQTLRRVTATAPLGWAIGLVAVVFALQSVASTVQLQSGNQSGGLYTFGEGPAALVVALITGPIIGLILLVIGTGILQVTSLIFGGRGPFLGLFCGLAFATIPNVFQVPLAVVAVLGGPAGTGVAALVGIGLSIWPIVLAVIAVRENNSISTGRAVGAVLLPLGVLFVLVFVLVFVIAAAAIQTFGT